MELRSRWFFGSAAHLVPLALTCVLLLELIAPGFLNWPPRIVEAAQSTVDSAVAINGTSHLMAGSQTVFVNNQTGYKFYRDTNGSCVYSKTTNGGGIWGEAVTVDAQTDCVQIQVWYDRWTPGLASSSIHIATLDTSDDDIFYNRLDPDSDTLLLGSTPVSMVTNPAQGGSITEGENFISITRATNGTIYAVSNDGSNPSADSYVVRCTTSCQTATNWTEAGTNPLDNASDYNILMPLAGGNIMLINRDISADVIRFKIWNEAAWSGTWTTIAASVPENATYDIGMAAAVSSTTPGIVYLAYIANNATLGTDDVIRTARYNGTTWSATTAVVPSTTRGLTNVAIGLNAANDDVYVAYSGRTTAGTANTGNVYWKWATSSMQNWSAEQGPVNTSANDIYGVDVNLASDARLTVSWFDNTADAIYADTILDTFPGVRATTTGSQIATVNASTTAYIGGAFVITSNYNARSFNITGLTITESGSIDAATNIRNVRLYYETDTTFPYDCASVSYGGNEAQFGATSTNGFSAANGTASFSGTTVAIGTTSALCVYTVLDILDSTADTANVELGISNPSTDITITSGTSLQTVSADIPGTTVVANDILTQVGYHWRHDDNNEASASSATGGSENTPYNAFPETTTKRLRLAIANEGTGTSPAVAYRLEYAPKFSTCSAATGWIDVGATGGDFDMSPTANLNEGDNTTNISLSANGAITDPNGFSFSTPNGGVRDTSSQTSGITLSTNQFVELEYAVRASSTVEAGAAYCFRVTNAGNEIITYSQYPEATIEAGVFVDTLGVQQLTLNIPTTTAYVGGAFRISNGGDVHTVTDITITASGTVDAIQNITNIRLRYDLDTSAPYDCESVSYNNSDTQFGSTVASLDGGRQAHFSGSAAINSTQTLCLYVEIDVESGAQNNETLEVYITNAATDIIAGVASVAPAALVNLEGITVLVMPQIDQVNFHWRNNNGDETTATSFTGGSENTTAIDLSKETNYRLRLAIANGGGATSSVMAYRLEWAQRLSSCAAETNWNRLDTANDAWEISPVGTLTDGANTTNIDVIDGGVSDPEPTFLVINGGVKDTSDTTSGVALPPDNFIELEYSVLATDLAVQGAAYCFRVTDAGTPIDTYTRYAEATVKLDTDFKVQRDTAILTGTTLTITAGIEYEAPASSASAFIRITNTQLTGGGPATTGNRNASDITVYIANPSNILNSITFTRTSASVNTRVSWEIVEYVGAPGGENEFIVRRQEALSYLAGNTTVTSTAIAGVTNWADVAVFITGQHNQDGGRNNYNNGLSTANYNSGTDDVTLTRRATGAISDVSYAAVEFTGSNWRIQRVEHSAYTLASTTETESIPTSVNSLNRTFIHTQKSLAGSNVNHADIGHEVWLSSVGFVSFLIDAAVATPANHTSVAWIIENTQTTGATMKVSRSNGFLPTAATANQANNIGIGKTLPDISIASLFVTNRSDEASRTWPEPFLGARIISNTQYELWRSDASANVQYRTEVVEWPTAVRKIAQNYYRFYVNNGLLTPTDPWPVGATNLGENTEVTRFDEPMVAGDAIRLRMTIAVSAAMMPAGLDSFKLQYAERSSTCSAIPAQNWLDVGEIGSTTALWSGTSTPLVDGTALSTDPPTLGDLLISVSDVAGTVEEENISAVTPYAALPGEDVEYDWIVEHNGAVEKTAYCFRMIEADGTLLSAYNFYPTMRTAGYGAEQQNWKWFDNAELETPTIQLAATNTAPIDVGFDNVIALRVTLHEVNGASGPNTKFKLQFSEYANFATSTDVAESGTCLGTSLWCYGDGGGVDNATITTRTLGDADSCVGGVGDGCGTHNESGTTTSSFTHRAGAATEFSFTVRNAGARPNQVYYFRVYDVTNDALVPLGDGFSYPSLVSEGASLTFTIGGLASTSVVAGVSLTIDASLASVPFGILVAGVEAAGAHRLSVDTNGTQGYHVYMRLTSTMENETGYEIKGIAGTNSSPSSWAGGCPPEAESCLGYHTTDGTLEGGSTRFAAQDTYARLSTTTLEEVAFSSQPSVSEITDILFRILVRATQAAGIYESTIRYVSVPRF